MNIKSTLKEIIVGILPILILITLLQFTITPIGTEAYLKFLISTIFVVFGLLLFLIGIEFGFSKIGEYISTSLVKSGSLRFILIFGIILGFSITLLEPDVQIFGKQTGQILSNIDATTLCITIAIGVGIFVSIAFLNMFLGISVKYILLVGYALSFLLVWLFPSPLSAIAFDGSGTTTGALTAPFLISLTAGLSTIISRKNKANNFCIIGIASLGPVLTILLLGVIRG